MAEEDAARNGADSHDFRGSLALSLGRKMLHQRPAQAVAALLRQDADVFQDPESPPLQQAAGAHRFFTLPEDGKVRALIVRILGGFPVQVQFPAEHAAADIEGLFAV